MLLSAVSVLVVAQSISEIPEGLMNNPVYTNTLHKGDNDDDDDDNNNNYNNYNTLHRFGGSIRTHKHLQLGSNAGVSSLDVSLQTLQTLSGYGNRGRR